MNGHDIDESISVENFTWSSEEWSLSDFVDKFPLPQIVKVQEGYYGPDEDSCLGADQILFLHAVKYTEKVQACDKRKRLLHIPLNCSQKIELRPSNLKDVYESVAEIVAILKNYPKYVRVTQGYYSMEDDNVCINPGDKLKLLRVVPGEQDDYLVAENQHRHGFPIRIPLSANAAFQPLVDGLEYYLKEATSITRFPFFFQFIDPPQLNATGENSVFNSSLGVLKVEKTYQDTTVICTTKEGTTRTVVSCPKQLEITVAAANGALIGDSNYLKICRFFHDGVSLKRIENLEAHNVFASRDTIREYVYDFPKVPPSPTTPDEDSLSEYVIPQLPRQRQIEKAKVEIKAAESTSSDDSDDESHEYTYVDDEKVQEWAKKSRFDYDNFKQSFEVLDIENNESTDEVWGQEDANDVAEHDQLQSSGGAAHVKNGILYFEKSNPPAICPKTVFHDKTQKGSDCKHAASTRSPCGSESEKGPTTDLLSTPDTSEDLSSLTVDGVSRFLEDHHLTEFIEAFKYNEIDGEMLVSLELDMMEALGMNPFQRKKLKKLIGGWRPRQ